MPAVARGNGADSVLSLTGSGGPGCPSPLNTTTDVCSGNVNVNGNGVVRDGDKVMPHIAAGCGTDESALTKFSSTVFANGKGIARIGDEYTGDNMITSGSGNVFAGG
jgi:uncharacterized Zn-binding protein involved in type VI secretion